MKSFVHIFFLCILCSLSACARPKIEVHSVDLIDQKTIVEDYSGKTEIIGQLALTIKSDTDLCRFAREKDYQVSLRAWGCSSGIEYWVAPGLKRVYLDSLKGTEQYFYFFTMNYKYDPTVPIYQESFGSIVQKRYNLAHSPENVCLKIPQRKMFSFVTGDSNVATAFITHELAVKIKDYEKKSGVVAWSFPYGFAEYDDPIKNPETYCPVYVRN
ncbi:MAG: hypothetical protein IPH06_00915 [Alphaproteobacteria bacterium]|nr:hypothetical protein [Alphaproteobacteria bacterium]QQS56631.1 MAG: hypothetical protein IPN28_10170 [Alphaproteobacteria bacterium]